MRLNKHFPKCDFKYVLTIVNNYKCQDCSINLGIISSFSIIMIHLVNLVLIDLNEKKEMEDWDSIKGEMIEKD